MATVGEVAVADDPSELPCSAQHAGGRAMMHVMEAPTRQYRALISVPITASTDDEATEIALQQARNLLHPGSNVVAGQLELLAEVSKPPLETARVIHAERGLLTQLPPDWGP